MNLWVFFIFHCSTLRTWWHMIYNLETGNTKQGVGRCVEEWILTHDKQINKKKVYFHKCWAIIVISRVLCPPSPNWVHTPNRNNPVYIYGMREGRSFLTLCHSLFLRGIKLVTLFYFLQTYMQLLRQYLKSMIVTWRTFTRLYWEDGCVNPSPTRRRMRMW